MVVENGGFEKGGIADLAFLSDCRSAAMVDGCGSVVWWCPGRFDSDSWFGALLDPNAGLWRLEPSDVTRTERRYLPRTLVLETTFATRWGTARLTDALLFRRGARGHELGMASPGALARYVECLEGAVEMSHQFVPRPDYGRETMEIELAVTHVRGESRAGTITMTFDGDPGLVSSGQGSAEGCFELRSGERRGFVCSTSAGQTVGDDRGVNERIADTAATWRSWNDFGETVGGSDGRVARSARVLKGLTHTDTGALIAAPTTSLPEIVGGDANWDYRYGWLRDSSLVVDALLGSACAFEVSAYFTWMSRVAFDHDSSGETQAVYGIGGERDLAEVELDHLEGFRCSRPVRIGNNAFAQRQLDMYGHVLDAATAFRKDETFSEDLNCFLAQLATRASVNWRLPDHGMWERREPPRHYSSSRLMCWVALDRALELDCGCSEERAQWRDECRHIESELWRSWDESRRVFPSYPGAEELDASALLFVLTGFLGAGDSRAQDLIAGLESELGRDGLLRRWSGADDGAFLLCSYWLVEALALTGQTARAATVLRLLETCENELGLIPEEVLPGSGEARGNTPLAISHAGYVCAALTLEGELAKSRTAASRRP